jgi:hypothetical protein
VASKRADRPGETGQASISFVAIVPLLIAAFLVLAQVAVVGWSVWSAAGAARAGARAELVGAEVEDAALAALPAALESRAEVDAEGRLVRVEVRAPKLIPLGPAIEVASRAELDPMGEG